MIYKLYSFQITFFSNLQGIWFVFTLSQKLNTNREKNKTNEKAHTPQVWTVKAYRCTHAKKNYVSMDCRRRWFVFTLSQKLNTNRQKNITLLKGSHTTGLKSKSMYTDLHI